jgi:rifampicin phosphotransferase
VEASPHVVALDEPGATDERRVGGKAAALARAARAGLRTLPGVVLTTALADALGDGADVAGHPAVRAAYEGAGGDGTPLVVRSSSLAEDTAGSSMAGQFESVVDVRGWDAFVAAVGTVLDSRHGAGAADQPIAVLVQPLLDATTGGVLFGVDPVTGRSDRRVVTAVEGGPAPLVSGEVDGSRYVLDDDGAVVEHTVGDGPELPRERLGELVALSGEVAEAFGGPQDVEWAIDGDGVLWVLQSRPVTTEVRGVPAGPIFGPGPVAETFPEPLTELERDLWVPPLRTALREAVVMAGAASRQRADGCQAVVDIDGRVAVDLALIGERPPRPRWWQRLNPVPAAGRLRGAWRVGRLRAALPELAGTLIERVDADLGAVPDLNDLTNRQLLGVLHRSATALRSLHAHEILMGLLIDTGEDMTTGASVALRVLVQGREAGLRDADIVRRSPVVLALAPPRVAPAVELPSQVSASTLPPGRATPAEAGEVSALERPDKQDMSAVLREALRLRVRWLHELSGRAAWELGRRLAASGALPEPERIRHLRLDELVAVVNKRASVIPAVVGAHVHEDPEPLPARFRVSDLGRAVPAGDGAGGGDDGTGAGGGVASGPVTHDTDDPAPGSVLVTTTLTPALGPLLPRLAGLVTETGSVLSHLAILARESHVATVVGLAGATRDLPEGAVVEVDGTSGRVTVETVPEEVAL